ncbi:unnamed protein product [Pedinophyceae sp. YPF-701]|nr:unnamed protein product [Pedinophyceae sp. YPF-701]
MADKAGDKPGPAAQAVLVQSEQIPEYVPTVRGHDFDNGRDLDALLGSMLTSGFQATSLGQVMAELREMISWRLSDEREPEEGWSDFCDGKYKDPAVRERTGAKIFLGFTSNLISSGLREVIKYLCKHKMVDCLVTTAGGVEEDLIKCMAPTYMGDFALQGRELRHKGLNRIGNLLVPNDNYVKFEQFMMPVLDAMKEEQDAGERWSPSTMIRRLGKEIDNEESVYYWCWKNDIPVFCPALTDGSIGDMLYFHTYRSEGGICLDIVKDIRLLNDLCCWHKPPLRTGAIILGGGLPKHHIFNANLMRNGTNHCVIISTATEWDGSDSGARPDEAISWGKIRTDADPVKVYGDATILFPLVVSQTFAKMWWSRARDTSPPPQA